MSNSIVFKHGLVSTPFQKFGGPFKHVSPKYETLASVLNRETFDTLLFTSKYSIIDFQVLACYVLASFSKVLARVLHNSSVDTLYKTA